MAQLNVNPTRMELSRLKKSLATAMRGHKLLKDKRDELMRQFLEIVRENKELRERVEQKLSNANHAMSLASAVLGKEVVNSALLMPKQGVRLTLGSKNIMSVDLPTFQTETKSDNPEDIFSYGYAFTGGDLDLAIGQLSEILPDLLLLAEKEKSVQLLAGEIERTRRRVNALEYVMIPNYQDTIRYITMKLDENERGNITRLMKVKDMMIKEQFENKQNV
ncbi:MAG: V-type ATP synthase subunit D [Ruminococcaceae bacterium]|nr:V-type ATP synthase subunit D [Oscillospiraceae bacterium]